VLRVDRFGNLVTNIPRAMVERLTGRGPIRSSPDDFGGQPRGNLRRVAAGALCALFGSSDHLEIAENGGHAATRLGLAAGAAVEVVRPLTLC